MICNSRVFSFKYVLYIEIPRLSCRILCSCCLLFTRLPIVLLHRHTGQLLRHRPQLPCCRHDDRLAAMRLSHMLHQRLSSYIHPSAAGRLAAKLSRRLRCRPHHIVGMSPVPVAVQLQFLLAGQLQAATIAREPHRTVLQAPVRVQVALVRELLAAIGLGADERRRGRRRRRVVWFWVVRVRGNSRTVNAVHVHPPIGQRREGARTVYALRPMLGPSMRHQLRPFGERAIAHFATVLRLSCAGRCRCRCCRLSIQLTLATRPMPFQLSLAEKTARACRTPIRIHARVLHLMGAQLLLAIERLRALGALMLPPFLVRLHGVQGHRCRRGESARAARLRAAHRRGGAIVGDAGVGRMSGAHMPAQMRRARVDAVAFVGSQSAAKCADAGVLCHMPVEGVATPKAQRTLGTGVARQMGAGLEEGGGFVAAATVFQRGGGCVG